MKRTQKTTFFALTVAAGLMVAVVGFNACTKQENAKGQQGFQAQHPEMTTGDIAYYNSIVSLKKKIKYIKENPQYKSGELMSIDSAIWLLESTFNYEYGSTGESYREVKTDSTFLEIEIAEDGKIGLDDLSATYYDLFGEVQEIYANTGFDDKGLILVSLHPVMTKSNTATVKVETVTGNKSIDPEPGVFGEDDYWMYGDLGGSCDGLIDTTDAAHKIWYMTNANIPPQPWPPPGYIYKYSDPVTWTVEGGDEDWRRTGDPEPKDNYLDYYLYYADPANGTITDEVLCLEPDEMNNYYNWLQNIIYDWLPQEPGMEDHVFMVVSGFVGESYTNPLKYKHWGTLEYAIMHLVPWSPPPVPALEDDEQ